ncbi:MAG: uncharacterized protein QOI80_3277, partial [Solirubrobacteraceae bacterium]|nr:uncharacterized protein [Solirubrobacteraceae bacterium]
MIAALREALEAARDVAAPDWLLCAGAIRDAVWDTLHGREPGPPRDIDVAFFGADEGEVLAALRARAPHIPWDARDQARVHTWYPERFGVAVEPFTCTADAIATFPETASCVGLRLDANDALHPVAPFGLDDLLGLVCRHNATRVPRDFYERRVAEKGWAGRW